MTEQPEGHDLYIEMLRSAELSPNEKKTAQADLYEIYYPKLLNYAIRALKLSVEDAEDVAHDTLVKALFTKSDQFIPQGDGSFLAWMCRILKNQFINETKSALVSRRSPYDAIPEDIVDPKAVLRIDNEQTYKDAGLSDLEYLLIELHVDHDLRPREIVDLIPNLTAAQISRIMYKAKEKLKKLLAKEEDLDL